MPNKTALITGASSGLGEVFANRLAAQGYNLVLVARRKERLEAIASQLEQKYHIAAEPFLADLSLDQDQQIMEEKIDQLEDLEMLVNNAGFGIQERFFDGSIEKTLHMIQLHDIASVRLTRRILPGMISRNRGGIIQVASIAAFLPIRNVAYSSTKVFLVNFALSLQSELKDTRIRVQALCPGFFYSEFHDHPDLSSFKRNAIPAFLWIQAEQVVDYSLQKLKRGNVICIPGLLYQLIALFARSPLTFGLVYSLGTRFLGKRPHIAGGDSEPSP
jgi:short-subunit dehydrogenase